MSPAQLIIDTRERVYQHIKDSPDGLTEKGVIDAIGQSTKCGCWEAVGGLRMKSVVFGGRKFGPGRCTDCNGDGVVRVTAAPWLVHACLGYLLAEARIIDTSDDATEYRWVAIHV